jgi:hypothetical protein
VVHFVDQDLVLLVSALGAVALDVALGFAFNRQISCESHDVLLLNRAIFAEDVCSPRDALSLFAKKAGENPRAHLGEIRKGQTPKNNSMDRKPREKS